MNSLRAWSSRASRWRISSRVLASWPTSSVPSSGIGVEKSPSATFSAAASSRRSRLACARAATQPAASAAARAIDPAIRIWRLISATSASTSSSGVDRTATQRALPPASSGTAASPVRSPARNSTSEPTRPLATAATAAGESGRIAVRPNSESPSTSFGCGPPGPERTPSRVTRASVRRATPRTRRRSSDLGRSALQCIASRPLSVGAHLLQPLQLLGGQARAKLRHHV